MSEMSDDDAAVMLALDDVELPSLFADDEADAVGGSSSSTLLFTSVHPLSADEFVELLVAVDDDSEQPQPPAPTPLQQQEAQPQQPLVYERSLHSQPPANGKTAFTKKKKSASRQSNKARDGRKEELLFLRKTVSELETRLGQLQIGSKRTSPSVLQTSPSTSELHQQLGHFYQPMSTQQSGQLQVTKKNQSGVRSELWREIAHHQCDERDRSERENIRLRLALESQLKVAKSLEKFLMLKAAAVSMDIGKSVDMQRYNQLTHYRDLSGHELDAAIFHDLLLGVDQMVSEVDAVYEANGLARVQTTQISAQTRFDAERGSMRVEVCASKELPFGVHETGAAVWNHYIYAKRRMPSRYYVHHVQNSFGSTEDTIVEDFSVELHSKNKRGIFRMRQVTKRVVEAERVVVVWRSYTDPLEFSEQPLSGLRSSEKGYIVIRQSSSDITLLQPCHIVYPCASLEGNTMTGDTLVGAISDFRMNSTADFVASTYQMVENVLLEQTLNKNSAVAMEL